MRGTLTHVQEFETTRIPALVRQGGRSWDSAVCISFVGELLEFLRRCIEEGGVYKISRKDKSASIEILKIEDEGYGSILSQEFVDWRNEARS